ncbi:MAG: hypothetical protein DDT38_01672 [Firmicutes bacterium]|nr:hypothetical protein [candidate division NPL-UPA2 bacterium]
MAAVCEKLADIFGVNKTVVEQDTVPFISALIDSGLAERASANDNNG